MKKQPDKNSEKVKEMLNLMKFMNFRIKKNIKSKSRSGK